MASINKYPRMGQKRPHTSVTVDTSGIGGSSSDSTKKLMLIGSAKGGEPGVVYELRNYQEAKAIFRGGDLLDAMELAWNPSNTQSGAGDILAVRVEDAKPSKLTIGGINFTSRLFGREANEIQVALTDNEMTDTKRLTVSFTNDRYERVYDNLGKIFKVNYTGAAGTATLTVEKGKDTGLAGKMVIKVGDDAKLDTVKEYDLLSGVFSEVNTIINDLNNLPDFEASFFPYGDKNIKSSDLDIQADVSLKGGDNYVTGLAGDITKQLRYDNYVIVEASASKAITTFPVTKLTGGSDGIVPESWADKFSALSGKGGYYLVPLSPKQAIHSEAIAFVNDRTDTGEPMRVICGGDYDEKIEDVLKRQSLLKSPRGLLTGFSGERSMDDGRILKLPGYLVASQVGGLASGLAIGESITYKSIILTELSKNSQYTNSQLDQLNLSGVVTAEYVMNRKAFKISDDVTTYNNPQDPVQNEMAVGEANDFFVADLKDNLDNTFIGSKVVEISAQYIKNHIQSYLDEKKRKQEIRDYVPEDVQVILNGDTAIISLTVIPIRTLKQIDVRVVYKQQILTA